MSIHQISLPDLAIYSYVIIDPVTKKAAVIDPPREIDMVLECIMHENAKVVAILETHVHADFISGAKELKSKLDDRAMIFSSTAGGPDWVTEYADVFLNDKDQISLGAWRLQACHTPGHTPEHMTFLLFDDHVSSETPLVAFTGDFLLIGSLGRPDLLGDEHLHVLADKLYDSVFTFLPTLPDSLQIFPSHTAGSFCGKGISAKPTSTLGEERSSNKNLLKKDKKKWVDTLLHDMPEAPRHFSVIKKLNVKGMPLLEELPHIRPVPFEAVENSPFILDVRAKEDFAKGHIAQSINIPLGMSFPTWAATLIPYNKRITIVIDDEKLIDFVVAKLTLVGLDRIYGYFVLGDASSKVYHSKLSSFAMASPREIFEKLEQSDDEIAIIDVRTAAERLNGYIENSIHCELNHFEEGIHSFPKHKTIGLICGSGYRSGIAASLLQKEGIKNVINIAGGMTEWNKEKLPVVVPTIFSSAVEN